MSFLNSIILGLIQGITEFLPISSSGHLILAREFLHLPLQGSLDFDVYLNTASLLAVIFCFWGQIKSLIRDFLTEGFSGRSRKLIWAIIIGTIPAGTVGFFYGDKVESIFRQSDSVALALIAGSVIMFLADRFGKNKGGITPLKGFIVGIFQTFALIPGVSRSGSSISGGILTGLSREEAVRFSFLLFIPISIGAILKIILDSQSSDLSFTAHYFSINSIFAFLAALFSGIWAIRFLVRHLSSHSFAYFIIYRLILAALVLILI